jgi:hypothetical protein
VGKELDDTSYKKQDTNYTKSKITNKKLKTAWKPYIKNKKV